MTIVKGENGRVCGGFTSQHWDESKHNEYVDDSEALVFSLDNATKYPLHAIYNCDDSGPDFGRGNELAVNCAMYANNGGWCYTKNEREANLIGGDSEGNSPLTGCKTYFKIVEIEIFTVLYS